MRDPRRVWQPALAALFGGSIVLLVLAAQALGSRCLPLHVDSEEAIQVAWLHEWNVVSQRVRASYDGLSAISFRLDRPPADGGLSLMIASINKHRPAEVWGAQVSGSGGVYTLSFPAQSGSAGKEYLLTLQATGAQETQRTATWIHPSDRTRGELELNGVPMAGAMAVRLCYEPPSLVEKRHYLRDQFWDHYASLDKLLNRLSQYKPSFFKRPQWIGLLGMNLVVVIWLVVQVWGQTFAQSPWSVRRSLCLATWATILAAVFFASLGLWGGKFGPATVLRARPIAVPHITPAADRLIYDFAFGVSSDPHAHVESPESWYVASEWEAIDDDLRPVLKMHPPSAALYGITIPKDARLRGAVAIHPDVWSPEKGDGVLFSIQILTPEGEETVLHRQIDPKNIPEHRRWHDFEVDLSQYAGQQVTIKLQTFPMNSNDWDWAMWGAPVLVAEQK